MCEDEGGQEILSCCIRSHKYQRERIESRACITDRPAAYSTLSLDLAHPRADSRLWTPIESDISSWEGRERGKAKSTAVNKGRKPTLCIGHNGIIELGTQWYRGTIRRGGYS
ncbi:hypothetical protein J6590_039485 [Homalodisca vitripennis]|nr:hypothetical protein J6590_039485 [Homalodisca vitripennis]